MTVNLTLLVIMGVLFSVGVYLLLERSLTRVLLGIMLLTNGANLLILHTSGTPGIASLAKSMPPQPTWPRIASGRSCRCNLLNAAATASPVRT